jgi:hypothetical protein
MDLRFWASLGLKFSLLFVFVWRTFIRSFQWRKMSYQKINSKSCQRSRVSVFSTRTTAATSFQSTAVQPHILPGWLSNRKLGCTWGSNTAGLSAPQPLRLKYSSPFATRTSASQAVIQIKTTVPKYLSIIIINLSIYWQRVLLKKQHQPKHTTPSLQQRRFLS